LAFAAPGTDFFAVLFSGRPGGFTLLATGAGTRGTFSGFGGAGGRCDGGMLHIVLGPALFGKL
jgi:hypothetical protein